MIKSRIKLNTNLRWFTLSYLLLLLLLSTKALAVNGDFGVIDLIKQNKLYNSDNSLGEYINLDDGSLSFQVTDVALPGNSKLPVRIGRRVGNMTFNFRSFIGELKQGGWTMDVPMITGVAANTTRPRPGERDNGWRGIHMIIPGEQQKVLKWTISENLDGQRDDKYVTDDNWVISKTVSNSVPSFVAISPSGIKYFFDYELFDADDKGRGVFAASRIEDLDGNWVTYSYSGTKGTSQLNSINSNDGRTITLSYGTPAGETQIQLNTITANGRVWTYQYQNSKLYRVVLPDQRYWEYTNIFGSFTRKCSDYSVANSTVKTPSGNLVTYEFDRITNGRVILDDMATVSNFESPFVATSCGEKPTIVYTNGSASGSYTATWMSLSNKSTAVTRKTLTTALSETYQWQYSYEQDFGSFGTSGALPLTKERTMIKPDGTKTVRLIYRVTDWREGLTERVETRSQNDVTLETVVNTYQRGSKISYIIDVGVTWGENSNSRSYANLLTQQIITHGSDSYTTQYNYNSDPTQTNYSFGSPILVNEFSSLQPEQRTIQTDYSHDLTKWVLLRPTKLTLNNKIHDEYTYDTNSRITTHDRFSERAGTYTYYNSGTDAGNIKTYKNSLNELVTYSNYKRGQAQSFIRRDGVTITRTLDNNGWVTSTSDGRGITTNYSYNNVGLPTGIDRTGSWTDTSVSYSSLGNGLIATATTGSNRVTTTYDGLLRPILVENTDGTNTVYKKTTFNASNQLTFQSYPSATPDETAGVTFGYDALQRQKTISYSGGGTVTSEYLAGNKIKVTDAGKNATNEQHSTTTTYLAYGSPSYEQATKIESPENITTDIVIDLFGNITSITQSGLNDGTAISQTEYRAYDSQNRLCQIKRGDVGTTIINRNTLGQKLWQAQGQTATSNTACNTTAVAADKVSFTYDKLGNQSSISYGNTTRTFTYDANSAITNINAAGYAQHYNYNTLGLLDDESLTIDGKVLTLDYNYTSLGHFSSLTYPDGIASVNFGTNAFGQATQAIRTYEDETTDVFVKGGSDKASYYPNGIIDSFSYGNDVVHKTTLNSRNIPSQMTDKFDSTDRVNLSYTYDNNNNIISLTNTQDTGIYSLSSLTYDGLDRLISTTGGVGIGSSAVTYDGLGNIRTYSNDSLFDASSLTYNYKTNFQLNYVKTTGTSTKVRDFSVANSYDGRGNVLKNGERIFDYNLANQMISSGSNTYVYDGYNRRIKTEDSKGASYSMYSQSGRLLYRETPQGGINYIFLGDKLVAKEGKGVVSSGDSIMNYKPFGDSIEEPKDEVGYTGHKFDTDLGLSYMQARYYDPVIGRFYSNDPIGVRDIHSFNRYAYANNNPYKYTDPFGKSVKDVIKKKALKLLEQRKVNNAKNRGKRKALKNEKQELQDTGESKSDLTPERQKELLETGKMKNMEAHHDPSVNNGKTLEEKIEIAQNPDNITFLEKPAHIKVHQNNGGTNKLLNSKAFKSIAGFATGVMTALDPTRGVPAPFSDKCADCV